MSKKRVCDVCGKELPRIRWNGYQPLSETYHAKIKMKRVSNELDITQCTETKVDICGACMNNFIKMIKGEVEKK